MPGDTPTRLLAYDTACMPVCQGGAWLDLPRIDIIPTLLHSTLATIPTAVTYFSRSLLPDLVALLWWWWLVSKAGGEGPRPRQAPMPAQEGPWGYQDGPQAEVSHGQGRHQGRDQGH